MRPRDKKPMDERRLARLAEERSRGEITPSPEPRPEKPEPLVEVQCRVCCRRYEIPEYLAEFARAHGVRTVCPECIQSKEQR